MIVGLGASILSIAALPVSSVKPTVGRSLLALGLLIMHLAACLAYFFYIQHSPADANTYFFDPYHLNSAPFGLGTVFTGKFTQFLKITLNGSFLECFLFFQAIGFWGVMLLMRTFQEIQLKLGTPETTLPWYLLFLPSIHFWTSAVGKDAPLFFAVSLCTWAVIALRQRLAYFGFALLVMVLFRAHIALITMTSLAVAAALFPGISFGRKAGLLALSAVGVYFLIGSVQSTIHVDVTDAGSVATFIQDRNDIAAKVGGGTSMGDAPIAVRFFSLLFRPLYFDADNVPGYIASTENLGSVLMFFYLLRNWRSVRFLTRRVFYLEYCLIFSAALIALLTLVSYNTGLDLRQRTMVFPTLLSILVAVWAMPRKRPQESTRRFEPEFLHYRDPNKPMMGAPR